MAHIFLQLIESAETQPPGMHFRKFPLLPKYDFSRKYIRFVSSWRHPEAAETHRFFFNKASRYLHQRFMPNWHKRTPFGKLENGTLATSGCLISQSDLLLPTSMLVILIIFGCRRIRYVGDARKYKK